MHLQCPFGVQRPKPYDERDELIHSQSLHWKIECTQDNRLNPLHPNEKNQQFDHLPPVSKIVILNTLIIQKYLLLLVASTFLLWRVRHPPYYEKRYGGRVGGEEGGEGRSQGS